jgi:cell division protease FtsH
MKNTTRTNLIALSIAIVLLFSLAAAGLFSKKPLQSVGQIISVTNAADLTTGGRTTNTQLEIAEPVAPRTESSPGSLDWRFWALLTVCGLAVGATLWRGGLLNRIPGVDVFVPIDAGADGKPEDRRTFDDIAGCEESIAKLKRVASWLESPEWYEQFGAKLPRGILAVGPPGTGKTLLARALAGEVNANFFSVHGSSFVEMFVGVGARRVRKLFAAAVSAHKRTGKPSIIFIDEIDAIGKKRSQGGSGADSERDQTLNQLLVSMQGFDPSQGIVVMAATNMVDSLDEALTRPGRFDYQVNVDLPDTVGREKIFAIHTRNMSLAPNIKLRDFAVRTPQFSGADIEQACNEAAIAAAERIETLMNGRGTGAATDADKVIKVEDFDKGIDYVQFGDPMLSRARSMSQSDKRNTAFHEAGHCAVQQALQPYGADPITKVTIEPRTKSLGSMQSHADGDRYNYTEEQLLARITTAMGGRVAQEHFLGRRDTGAANDFEQACNLARLMVTEFGLSRLGPILVRTGDPARKPGDQLANEIDNEWRRIVDECYRKALELVIENGRRVERIADALLAEQTILSDRFLELWGDDQSATAKRSDQLPAPQVEPLPHAVLPDSRIS